MNKRVEGQQRWKELLQAQVASGLSVEQFCLRQKICRTSFYARRKRLSKPVGGQGFTRIKVSDRLIGGLKELTAAAPVGGKYFLSGVRIYVPNGYHIETSGCDEDILRRVLGVVQSV